MVRGNLLTELELNKSSYKKIYYFIKYFFVSLIMYIVISTMCRIVFVDGRSMEPTIHNKDILIVNRLFYKFESVKSGDIIVFPHNAADSTSYIKRVIALPGDKIDIIENSIYINDVFLKEPYICEYMEYRGDIKFPIIVPHNHYFVLGDNRNHSSDSRYSDVGMVSINDIVGKAQIRIWPLKKIGII